MTRWQYRAIVATASEALPILEDAGQDSWEVCGVEPDPIIAGGISTFWLKRPLPDAPARGLSGRLAAAAYDGREQP